MINIVKNEIIKLFGRRKIQIFVLVLIILTLFNLGTALITNAKISGLSYGQIFPLTLFTSVSSIIIPIFIIILVTSLVTDEYADGSLKLLLLRQASRRKVLSGKMIAITFIILVQLLLLMVMGYVLGSAFLGWGENLVIKGETYSGIQGLVLTFLIYLTSMVSYVSFGMIILLFAILFDNSGSVVGIGSAMLLLSIIAGQLFPDITPFLISSYFNTYNIITSGVGFFKIVSGFLIISAYGIIFYILSCHVFKKKDILL